MNFKTILKIMLCISLLGAFISIDLAQKHIIATSANTPCDITPSISCSLVNSSSYSELVGIPVAVLGILWFVVLGILCLAALRKKSFRLISLILGWNIFAILFVIYLIIAEFLLQALCPLCTAIHVLVVTSLVFSIVLYNSQR